MNRFANRRAEVAEPTAAPAPSMTAAHHGPESVIGANLQILGDVKSTGGIRVDGVIKGDVDCASLTISENGVVEGGVRAEQVVIHGRAIGVIRGRTVMLHKTAQVDSDIHHQGVGIEMGTRYNGTLKWLEDAELQAELGHALKN